MNILSADSKVWWLVKADEVRAVSGIPIADAVKRFVVAFEFAQAPTRIPGPNEGYSFQEGRFAIDGQNFAIKELTLFSDGISVEAYTSTDNNLRCLEAAIRLGEEMGLRRPITAPIFLLQSMIVVDYEHAIDKLVFDFDVVSQLINTKIGVQGQHQLRVIEFAIDADTLPRPLAPFNPTTFRIERRVNTPYSKNRFFSFANTSTENHLFILEQFELFSSN